jgi:cob(I)alamin adenosyltransferase
MGHRLSKITTRTGDAGETGLGDGTRVSKDSARVQALGDMLLLTVGGAAGRRPGRGEGRAGSGTRPFRPGGEVSIPGHILLTENRCKIWRPLWNGALPPLKEFILPGGRRAARRTRRWVPAGRGTVIASAGASR